MAAKIDRKKCLEIISDWFADRKNPLVAFPDKDGFQNVVYLYDDDASDMLEEVAQLTAHTSVVLKQPVMIFIEPVSRAPRIAITCKKWLDDYV